MEELNNTTATQQRWDAPFDKSAYEAARAVLEADRVRVESEMKRETKRRTRIVAAVAIVWAICTVALGIANPDLLLVAEIGWVVIVAGAVFFLIPAFMGRSGAADVFAQYAAQLDKLESQEIAMPAPADMPDLVAAIDLVSPSENEE